MWFSGIKHKTIRKPFSLQFLFFLSFDSFYVKLESLSLHFILYFVLTQRKISLWKRERQKVKKCLKQWCRKRKWKLWMDMNLFSCHAFFLYNLSWEWRCYEVTPATVQGESGRLVALLYVSCTAWSPIGRAYVGLKGPIIGFGRDRVRYWLKQ